MNILYSAFVLTVWFLSTYFNVVMLLTLLTRRKELFVSPKLSKQAQLPTLSIICPAYNEEATIADSIRSLLKLDYPEELLQIIVVNDGSKDRTSEMVRPFTHDRRVLFIDNKLNQGKGAALNEGIKAATGEFVATMDADSEVMPDVLKKMVPYFEDEKMGAVTVAVKVKKPIKFLEKVVEIEYLLGLSLWLKILSFFNSIHVTPGPFSMYRRKLFDEIGLFDVTNMTEDLEIAHRIQKYKYKIACCLSTHVYTVIPDSIRGLYVQRKRWYTGAIGTFWQYKRIMFNYKMGAFGFILPCIYLLVALGLSLFLFTSYLGISKFVTKTWLFHLTGWNFWTHMELFSLDFLTFSTIGAIGLLSVLMTVFVALVTLKFSEKRLRNHIPGFVGFLFLFVLYQVFWASSFYSVIMRKHVKWR